MPEIIRTQTRYVEQDYSSDDDRSSYGRSRRGRDARDDGGYKTVKRYVATKKGVVPADDYEDDRSSRKSDRLEVGRRLEVDRSVERVERIERPRSALEYREPAREREVKRTIVIERQRSPEPPRRYERDDRDEEDGREVRAIRRYREREESPVEVERYTKEVDYYAPADAPQRTVVLRRRSPEPDRERVRDRFAEAAAAGAAGAGSYAMVRREQVVDDRQLARRPQEPYYAQAESRRDVNGAMVRRDRRDRRDEEDDSTESEEFVHRKVVRERVRSRSPRHKLHLAEGALAGAGAAAILANHREKTGDATRDHRGRKILAGAALGTLGAELATRARSRVRERSEEVYRERERSRSGDREGNHNKLKTGLALGAAALLTAATAKYISNRRDDRDPDGRGRSRSRSRRRFSSDDDGAEISKHNDPKHRAAQAAKVGAAAAAVAGVVEHFRNKSKGPRSKSRLRTGGIIAATGLAGAAVASAYEMRKAKQDAADDRERGRDHRARSRSASRPRSPRSLAGYSDSGVPDPEMGMVEYGGAPVYGDPAAVAAERSRERRRTRSQSRSESRSRSRIRDIAGGALGTAAAAIGIDKYKKRKEKREKEKVREQREAERERERRRYEEEEEEYFGGSPYERDFTPSPPRASGGAYFPEHHGAPPADGLNPAYAPPAAYMPDPVPAAPYANPNPYPANPPYDPRSQGAYNPSVPPPPQQAPPPAANANPYYQPPAQREAGNGGHVSSPALFAPQAKAPPSRHMYNFTDEEGALTEHVYNTIEEPKLMRHQTGHLVPPSPATTEFSDASTVTPGPSNSRHNNGNHEHDEHNNGNGNRVAFAPLSPESTRTILDQHRRRSRRNSDPSANRPTNLTRHRRRHRNSSRSPSPDAASDDTSIDEALPDRFDAEGRPLQPGADGYPFPRMLPFATSFSLGGDSRRQPEMIEQVERLAHNFEDVLEGRQSWRGLLRGFLEDAAGQVKETRRARR